MVAGGNGKLLKTVVEVAAHRSTGLKPLSLPTFLPSSHHWSFSLFSELAWKGLLAEETDAKGVFYTSPGRQPWVDGQENQGSAESATHGSGEAGRWPAINSKFTLTQGCRPGLI